MTMIVFPAPPDMPTLFRELFSPAVLLTVFQEKFDDAASKGVDRLNGFQYSKQVAADVVVVSKKCFSGAYRFSPYLENLKVKGRGNPVPTVYLNADCDLASLGEGLLESREGRLCLYGPPGTGKTAYGHYLARLLGQPLLIKRASDLISMWVGETEKNIADAFDRAEMDKSVLLIDEADSFLMDRQQARNSWEVTQVNEMLTCMENFKGIFIASTNLMDNLDKASVRRFDLKVCFGFLLPEQAWRLFENLCSILSLPAPAPELEARLARISGITPGNYATVARQSRLRRIKNCEDALEALRQESELNQEGHGRKIGFAA